MLRSWQKKGLCCCEIEAKVLAQPLWSKEQIYRLTALLCIRVLIEVASALSACGSIFNADLPAISAGLDIEILPPYNGNSADSKKGWIAMPSVLPQHSPIGGKTNTHP